MFGSKKIQELEARVAELTESLSKQQEENASLTQQLESANSRIAGMEAQLNDFDLEQAKEEARASPTDLKPSTRKAPSASRPLLVFSERQAWTRGLCMLVIFSIMPSVDAAETVADDFSR